MSATFPALAALEWPHVRTVLDGLGVTVGLWAGALALAMVAGLLLALGRRSHRAWLRRPATAYVEVVRGIPLLVLILWFHFAVFRGVFALHEFASAMLALAAGYAAFIGEVYRAGIEAVDPGQVEAARALGLRPGATLRHVVLPQALRNVLPALGNESIALLKDTSLASAIAVADITKNAQNVAGRVWNWPEMMTLIAILYFLLTLVLTRGQRALERRFGAGTQGSAVAHH